MATPRLYRFYPKEYTDLFLRAVNEPVTINLPTAKEAKRLRFQLYAFRTSLGVPDCEADSNLIFVAPLLEFKIEGTQLRIYRPVRVDSIKKAMTNEPSNDANSRGLDQFAAADSPAPNSPSSSVPGES